MSIIKGAKFLKYIFFKFQAASLFEDDNKKNNFLGAPG